jgi:hypothetical protein
MSSFFTKKQQLDQKLLSEEIPVEKPISEVLSSMLPEKEKLERHVTIIPLATEIKASQDIKSTDDLIQRARNIVYALGFRGSVGDHVLVVYEVLQKYEIVEKEAPKIELRDQRITNALSRIPSIGSDN